MKVEFVVGNSLKHKDPFNESVQNAVRLEEIGMELILIDHHLINLSYNSGL